MAFRVTARKENIISIPNSLARGSHMAKPDAGGGGEGGWRVCKDDSPRGIGPVGEVSKYSGNNIRIADSALSFRSHKQCIRNSCRFYLQNISRM